MFPRTVLILVLVGLLASGTSRPAHAQFAVIDIASLTQMLQQYATLQQQLATAENQLNQARNEYASITGGRGMELLLGGTVRNYLPANWTQLSAVLNGSPGSYAALAGDVTRLVNSNAVLNSTQLAALSPAERSQVTAARQSAAMLQATSRTALTAASERFASLQQLIAAISRAGDQKAALDLNARIAAEQGMLQNEQTKVQLLYQVAQSEEWARVQRLREQAIADQGSLRRLPQMGLQ